MRKQLLIEYIKGETSPQQREEVMRWVNKDAANGRYLANLKTLYVAATMPQERASRSELESFKLKALHSNTGVQQQSRTTEHLANHAAEPATKTITESTIKTATETTTKHAQDKAYPAKLKRTRIALYITAAIGAAAIIMLFISPLSDSEQLKESLKNELLAELKNGNIEIGLDNIPQESLNTFYTEKCIKSDIILPDGTNVKLNSDTRITFPNRFVGKTREVRIDGEAFFDVATDSFHPLIVTTAKGLVIKVTGTKFNIKSYPNDNSEEATLYEGKISLISKGNTYNMLPDNQLIITSNERPVKVGSPKMDDIKAWTEGRIVFDETPLSEVLKVLERWHGVTFVVTDSSVLNKTITGSFNSESIHYIMSIISLCTSVDYEIKDNVVTLK